VFGIHHTAVSISMSSSVIPPVQPMWKFDACKDEGATP
jgi:hypothetical protein